MIALRKMRDGQRFLGSAAEDLERESPLESCYFLGKMVEKNYPFSRAERGKDVMGKYPVLG